MNNIVAERRDPWWNGMLIGFGVGAGSGLLIELGAKYQEFNADVTGGLAAMGLAIGFLVDVLNTDTVTLFAGAARTPCHDRPARHEIRRRHADVDWIVIAADLFR